MVSFQSLIFFGLCGLIIAASAWIAFSKNIVYSAFSLLGAFLGAAGLFVLLGADFIAVIQLLVYIGGIMVLYLFAVLMTSGIADVRVTNQSISAKAAAPVAFLLMILLGKLIYKTQWFSNEQLPVLAPTTAGIGQALLKEYLLPFELASVLLLATLVGAIALARREVQEKISHD